MKTAMAVRMIARLPPRVSPWLALSMRSDTAMPTDAPTELRGAAIFGGSLRPVALHAAHGLVGGSGRGRGQQKTRKGGQLQNR